jgi:hypothetical protein
MVDADAERINRFSKSHVYVSIDTALGTRRPDCRIARTTLPSARTPMVDRNKAANVIAAMRMTASGKQINLGTPGGSVGCSVPS